MPSERMKMQVPGECSREGADSESVPEHFRAGAGGCLKGTRQSGQRSIQSDESGPRSPGEVYWNVFN